MLKLLSAWITTNWQYCLIGIALLFTVVVFLWLRRCRIKPDKCWSVKGNSIVISNEICCESHSPQLEWHDLLKKELTRLVDGIILFNPPKNMRVVVTERVEVRISKEIHVNLAKSLKGSGFPQTERLKISELMKVRLSGKDFDIFSLNEEQQIIEEKGFTEWGWDVLPQKRGTKALHLQVTLRIKLPSGEEKKDYPVIDREIYVQINPAYSVKLFIAKNWNWIVTALILPLAVWFWKAYLAK